MERLGFLEIQGGMDGPDITVVVTGPDGMNLAEPVDRVKKMIAEHDGIFGMSDDNALAQREVKVKLKSGAAGLGLSVADVAQQVRGALYGLEFLYQKPIDEQKQYEDRLVPRGDTVLDGKSSPEKSPNEQEIEESEIWGFLRPALGDSFDERRFEYESLKLHIGRFVLRIGGESLRQGVEAG